MNVNFQPSFLGLKTFKCRNAYILKHYYARTRNNAQVQISTKCETVDNSFETLITYPNRLLDELGYSQYKIRKNYMFIESMHTDSHERDLGLGTCLHLHNIMEMLENNIEIMELQASAHEIPFHIRLGFKPCDIWQDDMIRNMRVISSEKDLILRHYAEDAKFLLGCDYDKDLKARLANQLIYDYLTDAIKIKDRDELPKLIRRPAIMCLKKHEVLENKDFYNELFKKYKIDYEIKD